MQALTRVKSEAYRKCNHLKFRQPFSIANAESYIEERLPCNDILISSKQGLLNLDADVSSECLQTQPKRAKGLPFRLRVRGAGTSSTKFHGGLGIEGGPSRKASGTTSNWISVGSQTIINNAVHGGVEAQPQAFLRHVPYARLVDTKILEDHDHQFLTDFPISYIDTELRCCQLVHAAVYMGWCLDEALRRRRAGDCRAPTPCHLRAGESHPAS
ncbi:hypothetical protein C8R46DRAFT_1224890 [Mycena filopes]|nr:hypothetical protein C8R46DRAFT_1224890 [Mycena filopes]